ncbi:MAG: hypothetical protein SFV54_12525 [Bryobacteraceae bacterium]|nr:hypothetical protein [Bryobacteraceae bacterium]
MRPIALTFVVAGLLLPQEAELRSRLLDDLERLAPAEAPVFGIDTRLRTAEIVLAKDALRARRLIDDSLAAIPVLTHQPTRAYFEQRAVRLLLRLDPVAARTLATLQPSGETWDHLLRESLKASPEAAAAVAMEGLRLGAWPMDGLGELLDKTLDEATSQSLCLQIAGAFPDQPDIEGAEAMVNLLPRLLKRHRPAAEDAVQRLLAAAESRRFPKSFPSPDWWRLEHGSRSRPLEPREMVLYRLVSTLRREAPDFFKANPGRLARWAERLPEGTLKHGRDEGSGEEQKAVEEKVEKMIERSREKDLPAPMRSAIASEALELTRRLKPGDDRLVAQAMLTRDAYLAGDEQRASRAARMLQETFSAVCRCDGPSCDSLEGREACAEMIEAFAEYLDEHRIQPEFLHIDHPSLQPRLLLLELKRAVGEGAR